jgi:hypothetical protein
MYTFSPRTKIESAKVNANFAELQAVDVTLGTGSLDTTNNSLATFRDEVFYDFYISGCEWTGDSYAVNRNASMSAGVVVIGGVRVAVAAISARTFTASKDTYVYVDGNGTVTYTEVANNATSPSLTAGTNLMAIVVTGATTIAAATSINQGDLNATLPVVSSEYLRGSDSLGHAIHLNTPGQRMFARVGSASPAPAAEADVAGCTATIGFNRLTTVHIFLQCHFQLNSGADRTAFWKLYIDGSAVDQVWAQDNPGASETHFDGSKVITKQLSSGAHTIKVRSVASSAGVVAMNGGFIITCAP